MLNYLNVLNGTLDKKFDPNIYEYDVITNGDNFLVLKYLSSGIVTIYGNENLSDNESHVLIEVLENNEVVTYTLNVFNKKTINVTNIISDITNIEIENKNEKYITPSIISICIILIIILFIIIFKKSNK